MLQESSYNQRSTTSNCSAKYNWKMRRYTLPTYPGKPHQLLSSQRSEELLLHPGDCSNLNLIRSGLDNQVQPSNSWLDWNLLHTMKHSDQQMIQFSMPRRVTFLYSPVWRNFSQAHALQPDLSSLHRNHWHKQSCLCRQVLLLLLN